MRDFDEKRSVFSSEVAVCVDTDRLGASKPVCFHKNICTQFGIEKHRGDVKIAFVRAQKLVVPMYAIP